MSKVHLFEGANCKSPEIVMKNHILRLIGIWLLGILLTGCNVELKDNARELEALQAVNASLKAQNNKLTEDNNALNQKVEQLSAQLAQAAEIIESTKADMEALQNAGPPEPPKVPYEYDVGLVTTKGEKIVLKNVTFGNDSRAVHTRVAGADVFWDFASIDTLRRTGLPRKRFMPATIFTPDHQEVQIAIMDYFLAGETREGERVRVPTVEINGMKVKRRYVPGNDPDPFRREAHQEAQKESKDGKYWWE